MKILAIMNKDDVNEMLKHFQLGLKYYLDMNLKIGKTLFTTLV